MEPDLKPKRSLASLGRCNGLTATRLPWHAEYLSGGEMLPATLRFALKYNTLNRIATLSTLRKYDFNFKPKTSQSFDIRPHLAYPCCHVSGNSCDHAFPRFRRLSA